MRDITNLLRTAASLGAQAKADDAANKERLDKSATHLSEARAENTERKRDSSGFGTPLFLGLALCGGAYGAEFNDTTTKDARMAAEAMAKSFMSSYTGATEKTDGGGTKAGYVRAVSMGKRTEQARAALQERLIHWYSMLDSADDCESAEEKQAQRELARRYITPCGDAPMADGSWPVDGKGEKRKPKFNGRPARTINGVDIAAGRGTDRKAQFASFLDLFDRYGDKVLDPAIIDAFLDNGGKYQVVDDSPGVLASKALEYVEKLNMVGGNTSADAGYLGMFATLLARIAKDGLAQNVVVDDPEPAPVAPPAQAAPTPPVVVESEPAAGQEAAAEAAQGADDASTILDSEEPAVEGPGVVLGAPAPAPQGEGAKRPRRARRGG